MKRLSDYKDEAAIELWGGLIQPISAIVGKDAVKAEIKNENKTIATIAAVILRECPAEVAKILTTIDDSPLNGFNVLPRLIAIINEISESEEFSSFFKFAGQESAANVSTGSAMESIEGANQ